MSKFSYSSLEDYYDNIVAHTVEECLICGECVRNCPIIPLTPLKEKDPEDIMKKTIDFLKDDIFSEEVYIKAFSCAGCGYCSDLCPQGIDPLLFHEALKIKLVNHGKKLDNPALSNNNFKPYDILSALQTKPSEIRWLKKVPENPDKTDTLVFLGCFPPSALPDRTFAFLDILDKMGVNYTALAGGELCCGATLCSGEGKIKEGEKKARDLVAGIQAFSSQRVVLVCPGCYRQFIEFYPYFLELNFEVQYCTQFLYDNLEKLEFTKSLDKTVTLHDSCVLVRRCNDSETPRKLLNAIPGLKLVEMGHIKEETKCCGGLANINYPEIGKKLGNSLVLEALKTGADYMASVCPGCEETLYPYIRKHPPIIMKDIVTLINEAMDGKKYEDKLDKYWRYENIDKIIEESRETFKENGFTEYEMRQILPIIFSFNKP